MRWLLLLCLVLSPFVRAADVVPAKVPTSALIRVSGQGTTFWVAPSGSSAQSVCSIIGGNWWYNTTYLYWQCSSSIGSFTGTGNFYATKCGSSNAVNAVNYSSYCSYSCPPDSNPDYTTQSDASGNPSSTGAYCAKPSICQQQKGNLINVHVNAPVAFDQICYHNCTATNPAALDATHWIYYMNYTLNGQGCDSDFGWLYDENATAANAAQDQKVNSEKTSAQAQSDATSAGDSANQAAAASTQAAQAAAAAQSAANAAQATADSAKNQSNNAAQNLVTVISNPNSTQAQVSAAQSAAKAAADAAAAAVAQAQAALAQAQSVAANAATAQSSSNDAAAQAAAAVNQAAAALAQAQQTAAQAQASYNAAVAAGIKASADAVNAANNAATAATAAATAAANAANAAAAATAAATKAAAAATAATAGAGNGSGSGSGSGAGSGAGSNTGNGSNAASSATGTASAATSTFCKDNPDSLACVSLGDAPTADTIGNQDIPISVNPAGGFGGDSAACPAPRSYNIFGHSLVLFDPQPLCSYLVMLRPFLIALATLSAAFIVMGVNVKGDD